MTPDQLIDHARLEVPRTEQVIARRIPPELTRKGGLTIAELSKDPRVSVGVRERRSGHVLGEGASPASIAQWQSQMPRHPLPADLVALLLKIDGIHLCADLETQRADIGIAPLAEWRLARDVLSETADGPLLPENYLAISYSIDEATYIALDVSTNRYLLLHAVGSDASFVIASSVAELLDWLWVYRRWASPNTREWKEDGAA